MKVNRNSSESDLIESIRKGEQAPIQKLYHDHREGYIKWAVHAYSVNETDAIESFQEAVIAFYRNVANGKLMELNSSIKTYLFAIGKNTLLKKLRQAEKVNVGVATLPDVSDLTIFRAEQKEHLQVYMKEALNELGEPCSEMLKLYYYRDYAIEAIKSRMGYNSDEVVRSQKKRCLGYLRKLIRSKYQSELEL